MILEEISSAVLKLEAHTMASIPAKSICKVVDAVEIVKKLRISEPK